MSIPCNVRLLRAEIAEASARSWNCSTLRVNRIHVPLSGRANYRDVNGVKELTPGAFYVMPNGFSQDLLQIPGSNYLHLYFDFQCSPPLLSREMLKIEAASDPCLQSLFSTARFLIEGGSTPGSGDPAVPSESGVFSELEGLCSVAVAYLSRVYGLSTVQNEKIEGAVRFIRDHYSEPICNADIAGALHVDPRYLIRLFRRYMSMPPYQYLTQYRIERALESLRQGKSVSETAFACGYQSETAFRIAFKRVMGFAPTFLPKRY